MRELLDLARDLRTDVLSLTDYESLDLAIKIQKNELYKRANVLVDEQLSVPSALEKIAMELTEIKNR
jgi:hypothetical protein